mmetsp:Transcript_80847/g.127306  ORF Transcript_80847/g.127306 Transcript_80847/m.127306 type:complete len:135 (-) Transcript_80847:378-782(-)
MAAMQRSPSNSSTGSFKVEKSPQEWKKILGDQAFRVLRQGGTERPGSSAYDKMKPKEGFFKCAACDHPLYTADGKFDSSCGWPCFDKVVYSPEGGCHVGVRASHGQFEIICNNCGSHLGHVFYGEGCTPNNERH